MKSMPHKTLLALALVGFSAGAWAQSAAQPEVHVGDRWSWQHTNMLVKEMDRTEIEDVVEISDQEIRTRVRTKGRPGSAVATYDRAWNPSDAVVARYSPSLQKLAFPLEAGKKWTADADKMLFSNGKHGKFHLAGSVVAMEKVTVPAGTFDAYRVSLVIDAITTDEDANIGHTEETLWYAPTVKRFIKDEITFSRDGRIRSQDGYELLEFSLR